MIINKELGANALWPPFLTVVTRCYQRPTYLENNVASVAQQTDPDYEHIFIVDEVGEGLHAANKALAMAQPAGEYVMVLDDDDLLSSPEAIATLKVSVRDHGRPGLLFFKADHGEYGILPSPLVWRRRPVLGHVGSCDFISRADVWETYIPWFGTMQEGDFNYLINVWKDAPAVGWLDRQLAAVQRISNGRPE